MTSKPQELLSRLALAIAFTTTLTPGCVADLGGVEISEESLEGIDTDREQPIFGGTLPFAAHHGAVVSLHNRFGSSPSRYSFCTGTLISPTVVLTAAHCTQGESASRLAIYVGDNPRTDPSPEFHAVSEVWWHPGFSGSTLLNDISLLRLATPVTSVDPVPPLPQALGYSSADLGSLELEFVGFGRTETGGSDQKLVATAILGSLGCQVSGCGFGQGGAAYQQAMIAYNQFSEGPCNGDSGGPAFVVRNGQVYVGGMTSFGDSQCTQYGVSARADTYQDIIYGFSDDIATAGSPVTEPEPTPDPVGGELQNGDSVSVAGAQGSLASFTAEVGAGASDLVITLAGGSGDADLYVRHGSEPTEQTWDCRPYKNGNAEECTFAAPAAGTWHIQLRGYAAYAGATLSASWTEGNGSAPAPEPDPVQDEPFFYSQENLQAQKNTYRSFLVDVPAGAEPIRIIQYGGNGDADLYVKKGGGLSPQNWDCRPFVDGNDEECTFHDPGGGIYEIWVVAYRTYSGVNVQVSRE